MNSNTDAARNRHLVFRKTDQEPFHELSFNTGTISRSYVSLKLRIVILKGPPAGVAGSA